MLDPKKNRVDYGSIVSPPEGYELDRAIGMTYSMDLYALLALPVAMFYASAVASDNKINRYDILDSVQQCSGKIDVFCQKGKIAASKHHKLLGFLEDSIIEVLPPDAYSSFHPKLWLLRFVTNDGKIIYRLIVLSRNLTFDRSWDVAFYTDGLITSKEQIESKKLNRFIKYFYEQSNKEMPDAIRSELNKVEFSIPPGFDSLKIWPISYFSETLDLPNPLHTIAHKRMVIFSPFIDDTIYSKFFIGGKGALKTRYMLISRKEELDKINISERGTEQIYTLKNQIIEGESGLSDTEGLAAGLQQLHAKVWVGNKDKRTDWFIGSANATSPAFDRNTEMLVQISGDQAGIGFGNWRRRLLGENDADDKVKKYNYYEKYERSEIVEKENEDINKQALRRVLHKLMSVNYIGNLEELENGNYSMSIAIDLSDVHSEGIVSSICIMKSEDSKASQELELNVYNKIVFSNIPLMDLSRFVTLDITYGDNQKHRCCVMVDVIIPEERNNDIFKNLINDRSKFLKYIQFILSPESNTGSLEITSADFSFSSMDEDILQALLGGQQGIYESLMIAASRHPSKLKRIDSIIEKLGDLDSGIVADFLPIWNTFKTFAL